MPTTRDAGRWIRRFHPADHAATRLICFPHAGGSATFYYPFSKALSADVDVLAIQYPGRQDRFGEPCVENVHELADLITEQIRPWLDRPCALFGHSMGATIAFEVAGRLQRDGNTPLGLFVSARRAPSRHKGGTLHLLDDDGLAAELVSLSGTDARILGNQDVLRMILPAVRADYKAAETYEYRPWPPLTCPVLALVGDDDPKVDPDEAKAWREHTTASFDLRVFSGGHFYLNAHEAAVAGIVTGQLAELSSPQPD